jgi:predicted phosphoadenosine phosphosulfate sulfurtransferase
MKIYLKENVYEAAIQRINWLFDEFENIVISSSGGKDSTVTAELVLKVAEERGRLPVPVVFVDQEAEWESTIEYMRGLMADPRVEPRWIQCPIKLFNATSMEDPWLMCWKEGDEWMRPKEEISIKENVFGTDRFHDMFPKIFRYYYPDQKACYIAGVRAEESPNRLHGLTVQQTYKDATWGKKLDEKAGHYTFYPLYDWNTSDIWKAIHDNGWRYCKVYDQMYRYGVPVSGMRVSNLHHETAVHALFFMHEVEPETWQALTKRLGGINAAHHMSKDDMFQIKGLPPMFESWKEYRDYLTEHLITLPDHKEIFKKRWAKNDDMFGDMVNADVFHRRQITSLLVNDWEFVKIEPFMRSTPMTSFVKWKKGTIGKDDRSELDLSYIPPEYHDEIKVQVADHGRFKHG